MFIRCSSVKKAQSLPSLHLSPSHTFSLFGLTVTETCVFTGRRIKIQSLVSFCTQLIISIIRMSVNMQRPFPYWSEVHEVKEANELKVFTAFVVDLISLKIANQRAGKNISGIQTPHKRGPRNSVFPSHAQRSWDRLRIHHHSDQHLLKMNG